MNFMNEYGLLFAVAIPVATLIGLQVFLHVTGERATGLLPGFNTYPSIASATIAAPQQPVVSETPTIVITIKSSNDEMERLAA